MIRSVKSNISIKPYIKKACEDEGISITIDSSLPDDEYAIIKVDEYYSALKMTLTPKSVDNVVVIDFHCDSYGLYIIEFKNIDSPKHLIIQDIYEKFNNTITDFLEIRFSQIFLNDKYKYKLFELYLVSDAYQQRSICERHEQYVKLREKLGKKDTLKVDVQLAAKLFKFRGRIAYIKYEMPPYPYLVKATF